MNIQHCTSPKETAQMDTDQLRSNYLVQNVMTPSGITLTYTHYDRVIFGGAVPTVNPISLQAVEEMKADYFLERREIGILLIEGSGAVNVDGKEYTMKPKECLYIGKGYREVSFLSDNPDSPASFFFASAPAHAEYPIRKMTPDEAEPQPMGSTEQSNQRVIYKYIHPNGIQSCQLMLGFTEMQTGSVWNTMPPHMHDRRMELYFYFNLPENQRVWHFMGEPSQTRHIVIQNKEAVISPPWSIHSGAGTSNYSFVWVMAGENQSFADMDFITLENLK